MNSIFCLEFCVNNTNLVKLPVEILKTQTFKLYIFFLKKSCLFKYQVFLNTQAGLELLGSGDPHASPFLVVDFMGSMVFGRDLVLNIKTLFL